MNIAAINTMIDTFKRLYKAPLPEHPDKGFNMGVEFFHGGRFCVRHNCGTAACIMGWIDLIALEGKAEGIDSEKREFFNISLKQANALFYPTKYRGCRYYYSSNPEVFTLGAAIRVLQILRDTGKVNWNEAISNPWEPSL